MHRRLFTRKQILTIPNFLSLVRLLMIPAICWVYICKESYYVATLLIVLSGITDVVDGIIARKFNMVSDLGKILDPMADKFTQIAIICCLISRYRLMILLACLFVIKELTMIGMGLTALKETDTVNSAKWYGKITTVFMYLTLVVLILFPEIPPAAADVFILICSGLVVLSLVMYMRFYRKLLAEK